jgi:hypothetical protein
VTFIQEQEGRDAIDLGWEEYFFVCFRDDVNRTTAGFHPFINTKKMDVILDA